MMQGVFVKQTFRLHGRVNLGRRYVRMAQHFLYRPKVRPAFQKMSREGMPKAMRFQLLPHPCPAPALTQDDPHCFARDGFSPLAQK